MNEPTGEKIHKWIIQNRFLIAILLFFVVLCVGFLLIFGYNQGALSQTEVSTIVTSLGAFGTLILAVFTVVSLLENQKQTQERIKEHDKHMERRVLHEINEISRVVEDNESKLYNPEFNWVEAIDDEPDKSIIGDFELLEIDHADVSGRFEERYPDAQESVEEYNECLHDVYESGVGIIWGSEDRVQECIEIYEVTEPSGNQVDATEMFSLILSGKLMNRHIGGDDPNWWKAEDEFRMQIETVVESDLEEFYSRKTDLEVKSSVVQDELGDVREYILKEYPIRPQENYPTS